MADLHPVNNDSHAEVAAVNPLPIADTLRGKHILVTGATGFVGKVLVSMLLYRVPDVGRIYLLIRERTNETAEQRLERELFDSAAFEHLKKRYSDGFKEWVRERVVAVGGDVTNPWLVEDKAQAQELADKIDIVINSAGITNFNPSLDTAIEINTLGTRNVANFTALGGGKRLLHVSTCYVAGMHDGKIEELELPNGWIPRTDLEVDRFDPEQEIRDCENLIAQVRERADDQQQRVRFHTRAKERLERDNRDHRDPEVFAAEVKKQRRKWISDELRDEGIARSQSWGWSNIYTYSKSLGEQVLSQFKDTLHISTVRPAIVESALEYPVAGWNEGINTCAPLTFLAGEPVKFYPGKEHIVLDVVPVDMVTRGMLLIAAAMLREEHRDVYQLASSDRNPVRMRRVTELSQLWHRQQYRNSVTMPKWKSLVLQNFETQVVSKPRYELQGAPLIRKMAGGVAKMLDTLPTRPGSPAQRAVSSIRSASRSLEGSAKVVEAIIELFLPFIHDNDFIFKADNVLELEKRLSPEEHKAFGFDIERLDWRYYWLEVQMPGLNEWVYPKLRAKLNRERSLPHTYDDLVELFESAARNHGDKPALQLVTDDQIERYTYADLQNIAQRVALRLAGAGLKQGDRVVLMAENRPQWGMCYLGVLKAGGTIVPVDPELPASDVRNVLKSSHASAMISSIDVRKELGTALDEACSEFDVQNIEMDALCHKEIDLPAITTPEAAATALVAARQQNEQVASLIFTSGTTGKPKGVMLSHRNFTSLLQSLHRTFKVDHRDGFLSVLPLHHTFEFTSGFLLPLSRGATITYLDELSPEALEHAFDATPITVMIGVPALWQVFHRKVISAVKAKGPAAQSAFNIMTGTNRALRGSLGINLGPWLFAPAFKRFGGKIRYFISGGASLPPNILNTFHGLGFTLIEGYGLTETSPVLTVNRPSDIKAGSVGKALPNVEIEIVNPDNDGVGEIRARGPNVMLGYYADEERTKEVIRDGWFYTGDLGRLDRKKRLYIVGRKKEVIISSSGKNVYPDELEEIFAKHSDVEEIGVVGLPDAAGSERVAALVRLAEGVDPEEGKAEVRRFVEIENARLPFHQRLKLVRFTDEALPRTSTRKVKRDLVRARLLELESTRPHHVGIRDEKSAWLFELIAEIGSFEADSISLSDELIGDLGFDSLMLTELSSSIEERIGVDIGLESMSSSADVADVVQACGGTIPQRQKAVTTIESKFDEEVLRALPAHMMPALPDGSLPGINLAPVSRQSDKSLKIVTQLADLGSKTLDGAQKLAYRKGFKVKVHGRANIPYNRPVIVAANHSSHLDMGLVKYALWDFAPNLSALAASDYFFSTPNRKTYFEHFTNLIPVERSGSLEESLANASTALEQGRQLLIFPEGTRSTNGELQPFRRGVGYLAVRHKVDILPVYVRGTHRALPKGKAVPRARRLEVFIGEPLTADWVAEQTKDVPKGEAYRLASEYTREAILALKANKRYLGDNDNGPTDSGIQPLVKYLEERFVANMVDDDVTYYFSLGDESDGKWTLVMGPDKATFSPGKPAGSANCVLKCTPEMFRKIVKDQYTPSMEEFMNGTVKTNDPSLLMKFQAGFGL